MQWDSLAPKDTSWEPWDIIKSTYNLEDKVGLQQGGIDINNIIQESQVTTRPTRNSNKPAYLNDYA